MLRRLFLFALGAIISILFLSLGPENRLKETFYAYIDYFDIDKRVISHLKSDSTNFTNKAECQLVYYDIGKSDLLSVLENGEVDFDLSDQDAEPCQYFMVLGLVNDNNVAVNFELCYYNNKSVKVIGFTVNGDKEVCDF